MARPVRGGDGHVRARADVLLPAAHPGDSLAAVLVSLIREGRVNPWLFGNHPMAPPPVPGRVRVEPGAALSRLRGRASSCCIFPVAGLRGFERRGRRPG